MIEHQSFGDTWVWTWKKIAISCVIGHSSDSPIATFQQKPNRYNLVFSARQDAGMAEKLPKSREKEIN